MDRGWAFLGLLYLFLAVLARGLLRDLRGATGGGTGTRAAGVLVVMAAAGPGRRRSGPRWRLETITTIGRDADNVVVLDDPFASTYSHARLTFRGGRRPAASCP